MQFLTNVTFYRSNNQAMITKCGVVPLLVGGLMKITAFTILVVLKYLPNCQTG